MALIDRLAAAWMPLFALHMGEVNTPSGTTGYAYYPWGSRAAMTLPNDARTTYTYDGLVRREK